MTDSGWESIGGTMVLVDPMFEYASPCKPHKFFIGRESLKDVWVNKLDHRKKILVTNRAKEEFIHIETYYRDSLNLMVVRDTQPSRK